VTGRTPARTVGGAGSVTALAAAALAMVAVPLLGLVRRVDWSGLPSALGSPEAMSALRLSLVCSLAATALAVALGLPLAWVLARRSFPGRTLVRGVVLLPLVLPPVVGGVALLSAFSRRGLVGQYLDDWFGVQLTFSTAGVVLAETFVALPFFVLTAEVGLRAIDRRYEDVASTLGATPSEVFRRVTLPLLAPSIAAGAVLAWARALGEFGATITFAGNIEGRTRTLPLAVYLLLDSEPDVAVALSLVLLALSLAVIVALRGRWSGGLSVRR
jgi:molybdate transport system permease protein